MEPEGSLSCSQDSATCPYPEPDQSSPRPPILYLEDPFLYYPDTCALLLQGVYFPQVSPSKRLLSSLLATGPSHLALLDLITRLIFYMVKSTDPEVLVIQSLAVGCYHVPLRPTYLPQHPIIEHPQSISFPSMRYQVSLPCQTTCRIVVLCIWMFHPLRSLSCYKFIAFSKASFQQSVF
jgi:hypothetical protein